MPLEDEIIPDEKQGTNRGDAVHNFLDSAQTILADAVAKGAAEKVVDTMFSRNGDDSNSRAPQQEGIYPDLDSEDNRNKKPSFMDTAQNSFADAFAKRAAEKVVDGIMPSNDKRQSSDDNRPANQGQSGFDLGSLGSSLLESLADQVLHPSDKQSSQQQHRQSREQPGLDLQSELMNLAGQMLNSHNQKQQSDLKPPNVPADNQTGIDFSKVGTELLSSLAEQVLNPDKKATEQRNPQIPHNQDSNQSGFDIGKVGAELLESLAEQVLHPSDKKDNVSHQQQTAGNHESPSGHHGESDIGSILGSITDNILGGNRLEETKQSGDRSAKNHTLAESAGDIASSVLGSLAESMLNKNANSFQGPNNYGPASQWNGPTPQGYGPGPQGYGPGPQGYGPGPQGYGPGPQGYGPGPQGYGPGPQGYGPGPQGYGPGPQGYGPGPEGFGPGPQGYGPGPQGYGPGPQGYGPGPQAHGVNPRDIPSSEDIWSFSSKNNQQRNQPHEDESPAAELGSLLINSLATKILQPRQ